MQYKLAVILTLNILLSQAMFNRFIGDNSFNGSVKSTSMGETHLLSSDLNSIVRYNPSKLSQLNPGLSISTQAMNLNLFERRTNIFKDTFGDFLTEGDYVWNDNSYYDYATSASYTIPLEEQSIGIGISYYQLTNFNYNYEEEVRDKYSADDGEQAIRDPFAGYHVLISEGEAYALSYGIGWNYSDNVFSIGIGHSMNSINKFELYEFIHVDTMYADISNLSNVPSYNATTTINPTNSLFTSSAIQFSYKNRLLCAIGIESKKQIKVFPYNYDIDSLNGLYNYINTYSDSIYYSVRGLNYVKPGKLSLELMLISPHVNPISIVLGYDKLDYDEVDITQWKFGFEYLTPNKIPIRAGVLYSFSPIYSFAPKTRFSMGSGFTYNKLEISYGATYSLYNYSYPDLFPVEEDVREYYDTIYESKLRLLFSLIYNF